MKKLLVVMLLASTSAAALLMAAPPLRDELRWRFVTTSNTLESYEAYLSSWPDGRHAAEAVRATDELAWEAARSSNTAASYKAYLSRFPTGTFATDVARVVETMAWEAARASNTLASFATYTAAYPNGTYAAEAANMMERLRQDDRPFEAARAIGVVGAYEAFLANFPGHAREAEARQAIADMKEGADVVTLLQAGKVEAEAEGSGIEAVAVRLRRRTSHPILVRIPVGTFFVARDASVQNMVTTAEAEVTLSSADWTTITVDAACANRPRDIPGTGDRFTVTRSPRQAELQRLIPVLRAASVGYDVRQAAVWIVTDDANYGDLGILVRRSAFQLFGGTRAIDETETARAMKILADSGIDLQRKAIWRDRDTIAAGVQDEALRSWLKQL